MDAGAVTCRVNSIPFPLSSADCSYASLPVWLLVCQPASRARWQKGNHRADWQAVWALLMSLDIYACWLYPACTAARTADELLSRTLGRGIN